MVRPGLMVQEAKRALRREESIHYDRMGRTRPTIAAIYQCGCERASLFIFEDRSGDGLEPSLKVSFPSIRAGGKELLPNEIQQDRLEAWNDLYNGQFRSALLMARAALQRAVRTLDPFRGMLEPELDNLLKKGLITQQLRDNVDEVRLSGNDAAHPEELAAVTEEDARDSLVFLDDFLNTTIVVPERQRLREARREAEGTEAEGD